MSQINNYFCIPESMLATEVKNQIVLDYIGTPIFENTGTEEEPVWTEVENPTWQDWINQGAKNKKSFTDKYLRKSHNLEVIHILPLITDELKGESAAFKECGTGLKAPHFFLANHDQVMEGVVEGSNAFEWDD